MSLLVITVTFTFAVHRTIIVILAHLCIIWAFIVWNSMEITVESEFCLVRMRPVVSLTPGVVLLNVRYPESVSIYALEHYQVTMRGLRTRLYRRYGGLHETQGAREVVWGRLRLIDTLSDHQSLRRISFGLAEPPSEEMCLSEALGGILGVPELAARFLLGLFSGKTWWAWYTYCHVCRDLRYPS